MTRPPAPAAAASPPVRRQRLRALLARRELVAPLQAFAISRMAVLLALYVSAALLAERPDLPPYHLRGTDSILVDVLGSRWDSGFYVSIAEEGYRIVGEPFPSVPFFPLLPLAMRALAPLLGDVVLAGILVSNLCLLGAGLLIFRLVADRAGPEVAERAVWYLMIFPTSFFGSAIYSESLFLLAAAGSLYLARRGAWESAALLGFLGALSRFVGLLLVPMLLLEWWAQRRGGAQPGAGRPPAWGLVAPLAVAAGSGSYMLYLGWRFGDPLAFLHASAAWGRQPSAPGQLLTGLFARPDGGWWAALQAGGVPLIALVDLGSLLLFLGLGLLLLRRRRWPEAGLVLSGLLVAAGSGLLMSQARYMWVLFPAFLPLAEAARRPWLDRLVTSLSLVLLTLYCALFARNYWVG